MVTFALITGSAFQCLDHSDIENEKFYLKNSNIKLDRQQLRKFSENVYKYT